MYNLFEREREVKVVCVKIQRGVCLRLPSNAVDDIFPGERWG